MNDLAKLLGLEEFTPQTRKKHFSSGGRVSRDCRADKYCPESILRQSFDDGGQVSPFSAAPSIETQKSSEQKAADTMDDISNFGNDTMNTIFNARIQYKMMKANEEKEKALQKKTGSKDDFQVGMKKPIDNAPKIKEAPAIMQTLPGNQTTGNQPKQPRTKIEPLTPEMNKTIEMANLRNNPPGEYQEISQKNYEKSLNPGNNSLNKKNSQGNVLSSSQLQKPNNLQSNLNQNINLQKTVPQQNGFSQPQTNSRSGGNSSVMSNLPGGYKGKMNYDDFQNKYLDHYQDTESPAYQQKLRDFQNHGQPQAGGFSIDHNPNREIPKKPSFNQQKNPYNQSLTPKFPSINN